MSVHILNSYPNLSVNIFGIDIDQEIKAKAEKTIQEQGLSKKIKYKCISVMDVDDQFMNSMQFDCMYTSAAFSPAFCVYILFLCVKYKCTLFCSKNLVDNILDIQVYVRKNYENCKDYDLLPTKPNNDIYSVVTKGRMDNEEKEKRDVYLIDVKAILKDRNVHELLNQIRLGASAIYYRAAEKLKYGEWATNVKNLFLDRKDDTDLDENIEIDLSSEAFNIYSEENVLVVNSSLISSSSSETQFLESVIENITDAFMYTINKRYILLDSENNIENMHTSDFSPISSTASLLNVSPTNLPAPDDNVANAQTSEFPTSSLLNVTSNLPASDDKVENTQTLDFSSISATSFSQNYLDVNSSFSQYDSD
jgi:hypothetical protein